MTDFENHVVKRWYQDRCLLFIMALVLLLALFYNRTLLLAHDVDEARHMAYVKLLFTEHRLPFITSTHPYREYAGAHAFHPPLYYLILLPFYAVLQGLPEAIVWHLLRIVSLMFCLASLPLIYQIAQRAVAFEEGTFARRYACLVVAQIALLPMFSMIANMINNDSGMLFFVTLFFWLLIVKYPEDRSMKSALILGVVWGFGALTKSTALLCDGVALLLYLILQDGRLLLSKRSWMRLGLSCSMVALLAGWWHVRSMMLYGSFMPVPPAMPVPALPSPTNGMLVMILHDNFPAVFAIANWSLFATLWSQKDWIPEMLRTGIYGALALYCSVAGFGMAFAWFRSTRDHGVEGKRSPTLCFLPLVITGGAFIVNWIAILQIALFWHWGWSQGGRYLLPSMCGLSLALTTGWRAVLGDARLHILTVVVVVVLLALNGLDLYWLRVHLNPSFGYWSGDVMFKS
jgi:hypothetical protein